MSATTHKRMTLHLHHDTEFWKKKDEEAQEKHVVNNYTCTCQFCSIMITMSGLCKDTVFTALNFDMQ